MGGGLLCCEGVRHWDQEHEIWCALVDRGSFHFVYCDVVDA